MTQRGMADVPGCWWCRRPIRRPAGLSPAIPVVHCGEPACVELERDYQQRLMIEPSRVMISGCTFKRGMEPQVEA